MCTWLYLTGITNKDLPYSIENSAQFYVRVRMEGEFRGAWVRVCVVYVRVRMEGEKYLQDMGENAACRQEEASALGKDTQCVQGW